VNDIRDAFRQAGLISKQKDRQLAHEERLRKSKLGREGLDQARDRQEQHRRDRDQRKREEVREAQVKFSSEQERREHVKLLQKRVADAEIRGGIAGPRRFHYREPSGLLPCLAVSEGAIKRLEGGELAVVQKNPRGDVAVVSREVALEVLRVLPERVLHLGGAR
jgi:hypothetical protein